jgi:DNA-binding transcriptional MocR family regulator
VPTFANPSGKTMSLRRRQQLVEIAREYDGLIITDDVYDFLQWPCTANTLQQSLVDSAVLPRVVDIDRQLNGGPERPNADGFGNAVSNGSFSKIVGPGCRVGWAEGTEKFAYALSQWYDTQKTPFHI